MTVSAIYPLEFLSDLLIEDGAITLSLRRNDEISGAGDGRYWAAELARPLWTVSISLKALGNGWSFRAREIDAKIRALGVNRTFLWRDKTYPGARSGEAGSGVTVSAFSSDRTALTFSGLPAGFALTPGDRFSVEWSSGRYYMAEITEACIADSSGVTGQVGVYPYPPMSMATGVSAEFDQPVVKMMVPPDGHTPFGYIRNFVAQDSSLTLLQKV